ncbi:MAG TPA: response regulator [Anaerolineales bacterium]
MMAKPLGIIIEDDKEIGKIFTIALQTNFEIEWYMDGFKALARLLQVTPAIIILDLNLPKISGKDILMKIRADQRLTNVPVIIATADFHQAKSMESKADIILIKPISPIQLRELALRVCGMVSQ